MENEQLSIKKYRYGIMNECTEEKDNIVRTKKFQIEFSFIEYKIGLFNMVSNKTGV